MYSLPSEVICSRYLLRFKYLERALKNRIAAVSGKPTTAKIVNKTPMRGCLLMRFQRYNPKFFRVAKLRKAATTSKTGAIIPRKYKNHFAIYIPTYKKAKNIKNAKRI